MKSVLILGHGDSVASFPECGVVRLMVDQGGWHILAGGIPVAGFAPNDMDKAKMTMKGIKQAINDARVDVSTDNSYVFEIPEPTPPGKLVVPGHGGKLVVVN